ncbi:MAG: response regulator, partial [Deltaproteobacteria bacterium]|nr:response regulator [Deltaproteobacteria bacterium]
GYDGSIIDVQVSAVPVASQSLIMGFVNDITERKRLETAKNELLVERQAILENVPVGIAYLSDRKFVWCNSKAAEQLGYSLDEVIGNSTEFICLSKEDYEKFGSQAYPSLISGEAFHTEKLFKRKNNTLFWCSVTGKAIDPGNPLRGCIWIVEDISKRKSDEEELIKAREKALSSNRIKSEFLANMSHEIRTPLNAIMGFNKLLMDSKLTDQQKTYADTVNQAVDNLLLLINDILDFSKIEAGKIDLDSASFDPENLLKETIGMFQPLVDQKKLSLGLEIFLSLPKVLKGDKGKFRQVLTNLLGNAIKFTPSGSIGVKVRRYDDPNPPPQTKTDLTLLISVEDTGIGVPPEQVDRIFKAFFQGNPSSTRRYRGTGLGLAIAKRLVDIMGGSIWLESHPGLGSVFYFTARFKIGSDADIVADNATEQHMYLPLNPLKILLAEDNILNQKFGIEVLQSRGHSVTLANNGQEVLDLLHREAFDLILMDVSMPEMDGMEATKKIRNGRSNKLNKNIPIIAQTAHALKGDKEKLLAAGMDGYVTKPIDVDELYAVIRQVMPHSILTNDKEEDEAVGRSRH